MNQLEAEIEKQLNGLIKDDKSFAIYRLPLSSEIHFVAQLDSLPQELHNLSELDGQKGFVFSPFKIDDKHPVILIHPDIEVVGLAKIASALSPLTLSNIEKENDDKSGVEIDLEKEYLAYEQCFDIFTDSIKSGKFKKLVLSRSHTISTPQGYSFLESFLQSTELYPRMMNYVCYTPKTGIWMGSTPEIILTGENGKWNTVALAGTIPLNRTTGGLDNWDQKNIEEQDVVSNYIRQIISSHANAIEEKGPYTAEAGTVAHLKTDFSFDLTDEERIGILLDDLHPTPAVCGFPKKEALDFIINNEAHNREYYSGIIGRIDPNGKTDLYVNLRCAKVSSSFITLYAGGGLMPTSVVTTEWKETNYKMQTLLNVIVKSEKEDVRK